MGLERRVGGEVEEDFPVFKCSAFGNGNRTITDQETI